MAKKFKLLDKDNNIIFERYLTDIPLSEEKIIERSIQMFGDSDPCIIHKTYSMKKSYLGIDDFINSTYKNSTEELFWDDLPRNIREVMRAGKNPYKLIIDQK